MNQIKFSRYYLKLENVGIDKKNSIVHLLEVIKVNIEDLSEIFKRYDTKFRTAEKDNEYYKLPKKGEYLLLIFYSFGRGVFTTIRRSTVKKLEYYRSQIGQTFEVIIENKKDNNVY